MPCPSVQRPSCPLAQREFRFAARLPPRRGAAWESAPHNDPITESPMRGRRGPVPFALHRWLRAREPAYRPLSPRAGVVLERALFPVRPARALRLLAVPAQSWKGLSPEQGPRQPWTRPEAERVLRTRCHSAREPTRLRRPLRAARWRL